MSYPNEYGQAEGALSKAAGMVTDAKADFTTISNQLTDQIAGVRSGWGGQGASAFFVLHQAWTEKQNTIVSALDDFANSLNGTEQLNTTNDQAQGDSYSKLHARLK